MADQKIIPFFLKEAAEKNKTIKKLKKVFTQGTDTSVYDEGSLMRELIPPTSMEDKLAKEIIDEDIFDVTPPVNRYQKRKAQINPENRKIWDALNFEDKQKHLREQFELMASGQKTKEAVANELGYPSQNWSTIENAAGGLKYEDFWNNWVKIHQPADDILSQKFKVKSTNQSDKKRIKAKAPERIDPETGHVMKIPSRYSKKKILEVLENTKALKPDNHQWGDDEFSLAFSNEYKKIFPGTYKSSRSGTGGNNQYHSDRELAQKMLEFQGSKIVIKKLPHTLRYDKSGIQSDITKGGTQSTKADWKQTAIGEPVTGLAKKHARTQLLDLDGTWNSVQASIYANPQIKDYLEPLKQAGATFDIDHIIPVRFGGTNNLNNLRFIIKGSHMGETLLPDMTAVNAAVKNKSAMENEVFDLNKKMINLVVEAISTRSLRKYKEAKAIRQDIQTITNNFKETNSNTDFGVGMPHVVIKTGDNTAANVRWIDYLQLDDNTKKIIETDFIVYDQNLPSAGKSIEKTAEEVGNMYQFFIDSSGGKFKKGKKNLSKDIFESADGGFASIEEVLEYNNG